MLTSPKIRAFTTKKHTTQMPFPATSYNRAFEVTIGTGRGFALSSRQETIPFLVFELALNFFFRNPEDLSTFANDADGFSGADLASLAREAPNTKTTADVRGRGSLFFGGEDLAEMQGCHVGHSQSCQVGVNRSF